MQSCFTKASSLHQSSVHLYLYGTGVTAEGDVVGWPLAVEQSPRRGFRIIEEAFVAVVEGGRGRYRWTRKVDLVRLEVPESIVVK